MKEQVFDIADYLKFMFSKLIAIALFVFLAILLSFAYFKFLTVPYYETDMQVKLPQYCPDRDIFTAVEIANGDLIQKSVKLTFGESIKDGNDSIIVKAKWIKDTPIVEVTFRGDNEENLKNFITAYEKQLVEELNSMVSERFLRDIQMNAVRNEEVPTNVRDFKKDFIIGEVKVIKSATNIEGPLHAGTIRKYFIAGLIGLFAGFFLFSFQFLLKETE